MKIPIPDEVKQLMDSTQDSMSDMAQELAEVKCLLTEIRDALLDSLKGQ